MKRIGFSVDEWGILLGAALIALVLLMAGCKDDIVRPLADAPGSKQGPGGDLINIGHVLLWAGAISSVAGLVLRFVLGWFGGLGILIAEAGAISVAVGFFCVWLGRNTWAFWLSLVAAGLAWAWYRRASLRRWLDRMRKGAGS